MSKAGKVAKGPKRAKRPKRPKRAKQPKRAKAEKHHEPQEPPEASQPGPSKEKKVPTKKFPDKKCHVCDICGVNLARKYNLTMHKRKHGEYVSKIQCPHCHQLCSNQTNLKVHLQRFHERVQLRDGKIGGEPVEWIEVKTSKLVNGRIFGQKCGFSESSDASDDKNESTVKYMSVDSFDSSDDEPLVALIQAKGPKATKPAHAPTTNNDLNPSAEQLVEMEISVIHGENLGNENDQNEGETLIQVKTEPRSDAMDSVDRVDPLDSLELDGPREYTPAPNNSAFQMQYLEYIHSLSQL